MLPLAQLCVDSKPRFDIPMPWGYTRWTDITRQGRVLILDGNSEHVAHAGMKINAFGERIRFVTVSDLTKCL